MLKTSGLVHCRLLGDSIDPLAKFFYIQPKRGEKGDGRKRGQIYFLEEKVEEGKKEREKGAKKGTDLFSQRTEKGDKRTEKGRKRGQIYFSTTRK